MAGKKLFTNQSSYPVAVTLVVRKSEDPRNTAGTVQFSLDPRQSQWREYGNDVDIYLNGIKLFATPPGQMSAEQYIVITRGSDLDNALNTRNGVDFFYANNSFYISTRQVS